MKGLSLVVAVLLVVGLAVPGLVAAAPPNDTAGTAAFFESYATRQGPPSDLQAVAELFEATPDAGVPQCLGPASFQRTAWYRIPGGSTPKEVTVEASGRTLDVPDLALFVQNAGGEPPIVTRPNACAGAGINGGDAAEDRASSVSIRVPAGTAVLVQVGRRGPATNPDDDRVVLGLSQATLPGVSAPVGDRAGRSTPTISRSGHDIVALRGSTTTIEDPAVAACPSLSTVWRKVKPRKSQTLAISATGEEASSLAVFSGAQPTSSSYIDCVDRDGPGPLVLPVKAKKGRSLWIRVGADRPPASAQATLDVVPARKGTPASGGGCLGAPRPRIAGTVSAGTKSAKKRNKYRAVGLVLRTTAGPACAARVRLIGPGNALYAKADGLTLRGKGQVIELPRQRLLKRGRYHLEVEAAGLAGVRARIPSSVRFSLKK